MDDVLESYRQHGFAGPFTLFEPDLAQRLFQRLDSEVFPTLSDTYGHTKADAPAGSFRKSFDLQRARDRHLDSPLLHRIATSPDVIAKLVPILGPDILLWRSDSFDQSAGDRPTPPHQDRTYEGSRATDPMIEPGEEDAALAHHQTEPFECEIPLSMNIWFAFTPIRKDTGALWFAPGTHKSLAPTKIGAGFAGIPFVLANDYEDRQVVEAEAGQFFLFDNLVVHGTLPSEIGRRFAWTCRYVSTKTYIHRRAKIGPQGQDISRWGAVLVAGQDRLRRNTMRAAPLTTGAPILEEAAIASTEEVRATGS